MDDSALQGYAFMRSEQLRLAVNLGDWEDAFEEFDMAADVANGLDGEQAARVWTLLAGELIQFLCEFEPDVGYDEVAVEVNPALAPLVDYYKRHGRTGEFFMLLAGALAEMSQLRRDSIARTLCIAAVTAVKEESDDVSSEELRVAEDPLGLPTVTPAPSEPAMTWDESRQSYVDSSGREWVVHEGALVDKWYANTVLNPQLTDKQARREARRKEKELKKIQKRIFG